MPLHGARAPGQGDPRFDRLIVLIQPCGEALYGLQRTGRRALQPGIKRLGWRWRTRVGKVLGEVDGLGDLGLLRA